MQVTLGLLTYNHEKFVVPALRGVLQQTYHPLQVLITDDASTDRTQQLIRAELERYQGSHKVVIVFKPLIVGLLYSNRFAPSLVIIRWTLVASFFRTIAWILATPVFIRGEIGILILSEVAWNVFYVGSAIVVRETLIKLSLSTAV